MNRPVNQLPLADQIRWAEGCGAFDEPLGQSVLRAWKLGVADSVVMKLAGDLIRPYVNKELAGDLPPFKEPELNSGNLIIGRVHLRKKVARLDMEWLKAGVLLAANTGSGKTTLLCFLLLQLAAAGCPIWVSESYKRHLRHLRALFRRVGSNLIILRRQDWRWNLLQSHLEDPAAHLVTATDLLTRILGLPPRARTILRQGIHELYRKFGIWEGNRTSWPTLFDLFEWLRSRPKLNESAREAILDRLGTLLLALTPRCAAYRQAWNPADLARFSIDFEMSGAPEMVKQILPESTLFTRFQQEIEHGVTNGTLKLIIAFDDSQRLFQCAQQAEGGDISPMDELAGIIRGTGLSLWVIVQSAVGISRRLIPNLPTKIIGRLGCHEDYASLGADLGLTYNQIEWAKLHLQPGTFIGQVASGSWREPFVFTVPETKLLEPVDDLEAAESVKALEILPTQFAAEFARWQLFPVVEVKPDPPKPRLSELELRYLKKVIHQPGQSASFYSKAAGLNGQRAAEVRERLVAGGYVREYSVATGARGRNAIVLEPLPPAYEEVENL